MNEPRLVRLLVGGALSIGTLLALIWFFNNFELAEREVTGGYSQEARRNPFLAAERFLTRIGRDAASVSSSDLWRNLPESNDVLVVYRYVPPAGEERQQLLRDWIEAGGHLIVGADSTLRVGKDKDRKIPGLLAELGVRVHEDAPSLMPTAPVQERIEIEFEDVEEPVGVTMSTQRYLEDTEEQASAGVLLEDGYGLLQYEVGEGLVTVLADNTFLTNRRIGDDDHALALALLVGPEPAGKVWLVHDVVMPSLLDLAWQNAAHAVVALLAAALLWLWKLGTRLGPLLPPAQLPRRDISEHLAASATYLWRLDRAQALFQHNRQRIEQAWLGKHYVLRAMNPAERCHWIAARSGMSPRAVERALYAEYAAESDFIELSSYLQVLRTEL
jgi:hypothetical protein